MADIEQFLTPHVIRNTRIFNAPPDTLFKAWIMPEHLINWWGPEGFTNTFHEFEARPGGQWRFTMHGPEKGHYENHVEFIQIERPRLIYWKRHSKPLFRVLATFEPVGDYSTRLDFRMIFDSAEECGKLRPFVTDKNEENFDRLELELARMADM